MERESFEDEGVADILNRDFICIKVDREERPDIDSIYMDVCQALTGHGGWPLTIIMTPDKKPFYAATYLPKSSRGGMSGLMELLPRITALWEGQRQKVLDSTEQILSWLGDEKGDISGLEVTKQVFDRAYKSFVRIFDEEYGGFGSAPKFPSPHHLYFLLRYYRITGEEQALKMAEKTLKSMYRGGIYDHIGFGFARYSTDRYWLVPHFEKMLYDNALLAIAYLEAFQLTRNPLYSRVAKETFSYVLREMTSDEGGFYSAQDADSEGEEGKFYVWKREEIIKALGEKDGQEYCRLYDITAGGNFEGKSIPNLINKQLDKEVSQPIEKLREKLFAVREHRIHPFKDDKILTAWNGLMIAALAFGFRVLGEPRFLSAAEKAAEFILDKLRDENGRLLARYREEEALYPAYSADYAYLIWGLIELYAAGFDPRYLKLALEINEDLLQLFWDQDKAGLFLYGKDAEQLIFRPKESYDGALPSANSVQALNLLRLSRLTGDSSLEEKAARQVKFFADRITQNPTAHSFFLIAAMYYNSPGQNVVIVGPKEHPNTHQMLETINQQFLPNTTVVLKEAGDEKDISHLLPFTVDMIMVEQKPTAYICQNFACQQPITDKTQLELILGSGFLVN